MTKENQTQQPVSGAMTDAEISEVFLANGFKLNGEDANGKPDLRPYVYQAARALISRAQDAQVVRNAALEDVYAAFGIGEQARTPSILMSNLHNVIRFAEMLHAIEREFFMVPGEPDEDFPDEEPQDECLVNSWGSTLPEYIEQFRSALASLQSAPAQPVERPGAVELPPLPEPTVRDMNPLDPPTGYSERQMRDYALAALSQVRCKAQEGYKLVPVKPTLAMLEAGSMNIMANTIAGYCYRAMLAAAPQVAQEPEQAAPAVPEVMTLRKALEDLIEDIHFGPLDLQREALERARLALAAAPAAPSVAAQQVAQEEGAQLPEKIVIGVHAFSKEYAEGWNDCIDEYNAAIAAPSSEKDAQAARYRFLRSMVHMNDEEKEAVAETMGSVFPDDGVGIPNDAEFDASVDAAMRMHAAKESGK